MLIENRIKREETKQIVERNRGKYENRGDVGKVFPKEIKGTISPRVMERIHNERKKKV